MNSLEAPHEMISAAQIKTEPPLDRRSAFDRASWDGRLTEFEILLV